jgi:hypothetical protein
VSGLGGTWWQMYGEADPTLVGLLRGALAVLDPHDAALRAQLLARLAAELYFSPQRHEVEALSREAVALARRVGDGETLSRALTALHVALWVPDGLTERTAIADELVELAVQHGEHEWELSARSWRLTDRLESGDLAGVDSEVRACAQIADERPHPVLVWWADLYRASRALVAGAFDDAEAFAASAYAAGVAAGDYNATQAFAAQLFALRAEQGRLPELRDAVYANVETYPGVPAWRCGLAYVLAASREHAAARATLDDLASDRFGAIVQGSDWLTAMALATRACELSAYEAHATLLYELIAPYASRIVVVSIGLASLGPVAHHLGLLAWLGGRIDQAGAQFEHALALAAAARSAPWDARTRCAYARALREVDPNASARMAHAAAATARELGMAEVAAAAETLL